MNNDFEIDEAVMLGDSNFEISSEESLNYQENLGISIESSDEQIANAQALADVFIN